MHTVTKNIEKTGETAQSMAKTAQDSAYVVTDFVAKSQEINTRFAQRVFESYSEVLRKQTELAQDMVQELYEKAEQQNDAFQKLYGQWTEAFGNFPVAGTKYDPFAVQRQGLRLAENATKNVQEATEQVVEASTNGGFPIPGYDELNVGEVGARLDSLTVAQLKKVREYEKRNKNRETVIDQIDRKIKAAS